MANIEEPNQLEDRREAVIQSMYVPLVKENKDKDHPPKQLTITLRSTGDHERDKRRIKTLHGILTSNHGRDKFSFHIFENNKGYLIDFPNDTTRIHPELLAQLKKIDLRRKLGVWKRSRSVITKRQSQLDAAVSF
ncbi:MAG: hypothetical protein IPL71_20490, partial [Anaerolineales bacterium]|uniref:hypothetical protein n=1 Tax=Candidatus Villigracilis proximus TaxID=3140683 RepID=UPI003135A00A|nr:hypothetical protein [Anaerolineales bacterium]